MADLTLILLAYSSLVATIIGGILAFILYHFVPMKARVETMYAELYGKGGKDGTVKQYKTIRDMIEESRTQQRRQRRAIEDIIDYLHDLIEALHDDEQELPDPRDLPDPEDFFRGGDDD